MIRLTELVETLVAKFAKTTDPDPLVTVRVYNRDGTVDDREIELVGLDDDGRAVLLFVPLPAQAAGEPGAGVVVDESDADVDVDLLLELATGDPNNRGCWCAEGRCMTNGLHPACRERLRAELLERQRRGAQ